MCGPVVVEVSTPPRDEIARITKAVKQVLIQTFVAHSAGEAFHEAILHRLARSDIMPVDFTVFVGFVTQIAVKSCFPLPQTDLV